MQDRWAAARRDARTGLEARAFSGSNIETMICKAVRNIPSGIVDVAISLRTAFTVLQNDSD
jgi:hypothetical protein